MSHYRVGVVFTFNSRNGSGVVVVEGEAVLVNDTETGISIRRGPVPINAWRTALDKLPATHQLVLRGVQVTAFNIETQD